MLGPIIFVFKLKPTSDPPDFFSAQPNLSILPKIRRSTSLSLGEERVSSSEITNDTDSDSRLRMLRVTKFVKVKYDQVFLPTVLLQSKTKYIDEEYPSCNDFALS